MLDHLPTILTIALALAAYLSVGLLIATLLWKQWSWAERFCIAPFCSIAVIILVLKALHRFGVWLPYAPRTWVLGGMLAVTLGSTALMVALARRAAGSSRRRSSAST